MLSYWRMAVIKRILFSMLVDWIFSFKLAKGFFFFLFFHLNVLASWNTNSRERTVSDCIWKMRMLTNFSLKGRWCSNNYACGYGLSLFTLRLGYTSLHFRTLCQITRLPCTELLVRITLRSSLLTKHQVRFPSWETSDWLFHWKIPRLEYLFVRRLFAFQKWQLPMLQSWTPLNGWWYWKLYWQSTCLCNVDLACTFHVEIFTFLRSHFNLRMSYNLWSHGTDSDD